LAAPARSDLGCTADLGAVTHTTRIPEARVDLKVSDKPVILVEPWTKVGDLAQLRQR